MATPSLVQRFRQTLGRAFRETGQALDRLGVKVASLAATKHDFYDDPVPYEDHLSRHRHQFPLLASGRPMVHPDAAYLAPCSTLIGSVRVGPGSSIWYGAVLRADQCANANNLEIPWQLDGKVEEDKEEDKDKIENNSESNDNNDSLRKDIAKHNEDDTYPGGGIFIGADTNIQDGAIVTARSNHCRIGDGVTVGHMAQIHSATVMDYSLIGMGSIIQEGAVVESESMVAAGAVVGPGTVVRAGELWVGHPARKIRDLTAEQRDKLHYQSSEYVNVAGTHQDVMELGGNLSPELLEKWYPSLPPPPPTEEETEEPEVVQEGAPQR